MQELKTAKNGRFFGPYSLKTEKVINTLRFRPYPFAQAGAHALFQGGLAFAQGSDFWQGAAIAAASSLVGGATASGGPVSQSAMGAFTGGFTGGLLTTGDIGAANKGGLNGLVTGIGIGATAGGVGSYVSAKANDVNPWTGVKENAIVIGEGMKSRVIPASKDLNAQNIGDFPDNIDAFLGNKKLRLDGLPPTPEGLKYNANWIDKAVNAGRPIYDIGPSGVKVNSSYYNLEVGRTFNYHNLHRANYNGFFYNNQGIPRIRLIRF